MNKWYRESNQPMQSAINNITHKVVGVLLTLSLTLPIFSQSIDRVNSLAELRSKLGGNNQHIKLDPGNYEITDLPSNQRHFRISGNNNTIDLTGVYINWPVGKADSHMSITGDNNTVRGGEFEDTYIDGTTLITDFSAYNRDRKNFANGGFTNVTITGDDNRIVGFKMTVRGSYPYGYGSMYGIGAGNSYGLNKRCGILIKGENTEIDSVEVQQQAFCHAIFMQSPADNTLIKNSLVEGQVRLGADMYNETHPDDLPVRSNYLMHFDASGGDLNNNQPIPKDQMFTLTEDGIRVYTNGGSARVENTTVKKTRGGIRLYLSSGASVINSKAIDCGATNWNMPNGGTVEGSYGNFAYAPLSDFRLGRSNQELEITIIPSPHATGSHNLADVQGNNHEIVFHRSPGPIDPTTRPIVVTGDGSTIRNETEYHIILESGASRNMIYSAGPVEDNGSNNTIVKIELGIPPGTSTKESHGIKKASPHKVVLMNGEHLPSQNQIYDLKGRLKKLSSPQTSSFNPGVYFIKKYP